MIMTTDINMGSLPQILFQLYLINFHSVLFNGFPISIYSKTKELREE